MLKSFTLFSAILLLSAPTFANNVSEPGDIYIGFNVGNADYGIYDDAYTTEELSNSDYTFDDSDTGMQFYLGYQVTQYFAVEASYTDLGQASMKVDISNSLVKNVNGISYTYNLSGSAKTSLATTTKTLALVARYPIGENLFLKAKLGLNQWEIAPLLTLDYRVEIPEFNIYESVYRSEKLKTESDLDSFGSLGVEYALDSFSITADYQVFTLDERILESEINLLSAGIKISF
ncbi:outer membrane beta-barrel protein [uncultured Psychrosphaera sp.]|uniref:outer membrane beta-barrel protein n=1 Tax=uncultured Psychrosphaera sp. TaxID=1403522 RepID=UPI0026025B97|nr:outer membrane beta-barrel protein [uncultured Psychrosphaera sp.]